MEILVTDEPPNLIGFQLRAVGTKIDVEGDSKYCSSSRCEGNRLRGDYCFFTAANARISCRAALTRAASFGGSWGFLTLVTAAGHLHRFECAADYRRERTFGSRGKRICHRIASLKLSEQARRHFGVKDATATARTGPQDDQSRFVPNRFEFHRRRHKGQPISQLPSLRSSRSFPRTPASHPPASAPARPAQLRGRTLTDERSCAVSNLVWCQ